MAGRRISELFFELRAKTEGLQKDLDESQRQLGKWSSFVVANPTAVAGALGAALLGVAVKATMMAAETDKAIRSITANLPKGTASAAELRDTIDDVAKASGAARSQVADLAKEVARLGAGSQAEFKAKLNAAQLISDATGIDPIAAAQGIDQLTDLFEVGADKIVESVAKLAAAARGRVDFESLFGAFQAAAPRIRELGLTVDEATRAIVRLLDEGRSAKQVAKIFNEHDAEQLRAYGAAAQDAGDKVQELIDRANGKRSSPEAQQNRIREEINKHLEDLGTRILPLVDQGLSAVLAVLDKLSRHQTLLKVLFPFAAPIISQAAKPLNAKELAAPLASDPTLDAALKASGVKPPPGPGLGPSIEDQKQADEAAKRLIEAGERLKLFREKFALDLDAFFKELEAKQKRTAAEIQDIAADMTVTLVDDMQGALVKLLAHLKEIGADQSFIDNVKEWQQSLIIAQQAIEDTDTKLKQLHDAADAGVLPPLKEQAALTEQARIIQRTIDLLGKGKETQAARLKLEQQLEKIEARKTELANQNTAAIANAANETETFRQHAAGAASAVEAAANAAYGLVQAFGLGNTELGKMVAGVGQVAGGLSKVLAGGLSGAEAFGAWGAIIGGSIALISTAFSGESAADKERKRTLEENTKAIQQLSSKVGLLGQVSLAGTTAAAAFHAIPAIDLSSNHPFAGLSPEELRAINDAAKALGITLDGSVQSILQLTRALSDFLGKLIEFNDDFASSINYFDAGLKIFGSQGPLGDLTAFLDAAGKSSPALKEIGDLVKSGDLDGARKKIEEFFKTMAAGGEALDAAFVGITGDEFLSALQRIIDYLNQLGATTAVVADKIAESVKTIDEVLHDLSLTESILGTNPTQHAKAVASAYGFDLSGFDLSTPAGVDSAKRYLQKLFITGKLPGARGVNDEGIAAVIKALEGITFPDDAAAAGAGKRAGAGGSKEAIATAAKSLTEVTGNRMADYLASILAVNRHELQLMQSFLDALTRPIITGPILPPTLPPWFAGGGLSASALSAPAGLVVRVTIINHIHAPIKGEDANALGHTIGKTAGKELAKMIDEYQGDAYAQAQARAGSTLKPV